MKKIMLVLFAAVIAVSMSAFTNASKKFTLYYYLDGTTWHSINLGSRPCPVGTQNDCFYKIDGVDKQVYFSESTGDPVRKP